ncbi:MAG TPA: TnsA endonuclease N-terminal domain-containing protein [Pyrinomonadaceae bacterium]|nr:TnsA endonuclease N-terminal domain-containing protein [Pyrinomonadaceae bacterium]
MSTRKPPNRGSRCKNVGKFFSVKMNTMLWFESLLEEALMYLLDFDPGVRRFREQPCRIRYILDGKTRHYTPDILVERVNEKQIIEVKPKKKVMNEKYDLLFRIILPICEEAGYRFKVFTEEMIMQQPMLNNIKALWSYARTPLYPQHQIFSREFLQENPLVSLGEVFESFQQKNIPKQVVYALLFWGLIDFDLTEPLGLNSHVYLPGIASSDGRKVMQ